MKIANIVYEKDLVNHTKVDFVNYINSPMDYDSLDNSLPTLYVGWSFMKVCNPTNEIINNASILHKKIIGNELYWEFSFDESKSSHVKGIESFIKSVPHFYFSPRYSYVNLDPVFFQLATINDLMDVVPKKINSMYQYKNEMIYIIVDDKIWGINLKMYDFFKFSIEEIISCLRERTETLHIDLEGVSYQSFYKIFPDFPQLKRYTIVLLSK